MRRLALFALAVRKFPRQDPLRLWQMCGPGRHRRIVGGHPPLPVTDRTVLPRTG